MGETTAPATPEKAPKAASSAETTAHMTADELLVVVGNIRAANPSVGIKKVVVGVKAAYPAWKSVGAKEVREALKTLEDNPAALGAAIAATIRSGRQLKPQVSASQQAPAESPMGG